MASNHPRRRSVVYPSYVHRSATGLTTLASVWPDTGIRAWGQR